MKVVILGGGLTGLTTAWKLSSKGINVEIIESEKQIGGLTKSFRYKNYNFDYGPHGFEPYSKKSFEEIKGLLGEDFKDIGEKKIKIMFRNNLFDYPLRISSALFNLNPLTSLKSIIDYFYYNLRRKIIHPKDDSFETWLKNRFGKTLYNIFFCPYTKKVWVIDPKELDYRFAAERIPTISIFKILALLFFFKSKKHKKVPHMFYPKKGIQQICDSMKEEIIKNKGKIYTNTKVKKIVTKYNKVTQLILHNNKVIKDFDYVISTIPITELVKLISPNKQIKNIAKRLKFRSIIFLFLILKRKKIMKDHWIYYQDGDIIFNRVHENKMFSPLSAPKDRTGLAIEFSEDIDLTDKQLLKIIKKNLKKSKLVNEGEIEKYFIKKIPYAYPIYTKGYKENLNILKEELKKIKNIVSCGRQGMFRYLDMHHCVDIGLTLSDEIINKTYNFDKIENIVAKKEY